MADDRDTPGKDAPDPWADLESAGDDTAGGGSDLQAFSFGDDAERPTAETTPDAGLPASDMGDGSEESAGDGSEEVLIGGGAWDDEPAPDRAQRSGEPLAESFGLGEVMEASESGTEPLHASVGAAAVSKPAGPRKPRPQSGGIGQMIGIMLGGAMAIPITLAILIWGFGKDPFGATKHMPEQIAFLLPAKFQRGGGGDRKDRGEDLGLPVPPAPSSDRSAGTSEADPAPQVEPDDRVAVNASASEPPVTDPKSSPTGAAVATPADPPAEPPAGPSAEPPVAAPPPAVVAPVPPPLDTAALMAALGEADAAAEALRAMSDPEDPARKPLLTDWYKRLAAVAEELVRLERVAAESGRALTRPPEGVDALHAGIAAHDGLRTELARLGRMWLAASKRNGDGVVLPVTFDSARRAGPYWSSQATLHLPQGETRRIMVVSRDEPGCVAGDSIVVTGVILGEGVIWAADVRSGVATKPVTPL